TNSTQREQFRSVTTSFIKELRAENKPDLLSLFISEYSISSEEGLSLMTLVEAFLRVPDNKTRDKLFSDKISNKPWSKHLGGKKSSMVNMATIALSVADMMISHGHSASIKDRIKHALDILARPGIRFSALNVMRFFGSQFVFAEDIGKALKAAKNTAAVHSFDMLGEAAWTMDDADRYFLSYKKALIAIGKSSEGDDIIRANGISVKLSALHPKYDFMHRARVLNELVPRVLTLIDIAEQYNIAINIDAEEAERLDLSLDVIEAIAESKAGTAWQGFGVVVQAYQKRAPLVIDWLYELSKKQHLKIMLRLVKGAYWDSEIKNAQVLGDVDYPVFSKKANTDYCYLVCAQKLLKMRDRIYPQFASHNAHTLISVCEIAGNNKGFEVQRLHGMGESLHNQLASQYGVVSRIYAPIGSHKDLLAYLMRRLLENGANSSFINHLFDENIKPSELASDVLSEVESSPQASHPKIPLPKDIYQLVRGNSQSIVLSEQDVVDALREAQKPWIDYEWRANSIVATSIDGDNSEHRALNPADLSDALGCVAFTHETQVKQCVLDARVAFDAKIHPQELILESLERAADLFEANQAELMVLAMREAGKTYQDAIDEVREAVDFLRYYANLARGVMPEQREALGVFICISPWNFPLAIFTGQVAAALAAGNAVIAKPAESTSLIGYRATQLFHEAGIPIGLLQLVLGKGADVGEVLTSDASISGVAFTGSTQVAKRIKRNLIANSNARLIAETGGLNAMVVDSTALSEQVTRDVIDSAFKSAGQRCSALRILLIQEDCFDGVSTMIKGAMHELNLGNPKYLNTDCGPVINADAKQKLQAHIDNAGAHAKVIAGVRHGNVNGYYVAPTMIELDSLDDINEEFFGPILHVISYKSEHLEDMIDQLNAKGFGLTFGIHSRIKTQVDLVSKRINAGNIYINRNQVGAIVGSQPFGGEGFSGTGPKAGGPSALYGYSRKLDTNIASTDAVLPSKSAVFFDQLMIDQIASVFSALKQSFINHLADTVNQRLQSVELPGPTGESNTLSYHPKGCVLCLGPSDVDALQQSIIALALGNSAMSMLNQQDFDLLIKLGIDSNTLFRMNTTPSKEFLQSDCYDAILYSGDTKTIELTVLDRNAGITPVVGSINEPWRLLNERVITVDTTASGGNANLLAL
ncbi:MAG TPA: bifunctional proline dehydrogenase/L-glutamate gamma-semialdehyde dehydrogenase PutA, partial [Candidatus Thioglobus sp.]|nr:bifunctional proline dehydrogenase/L-glutamate gamma-semialdehyde dehydrogenase PutA [Candidatus Thioglobus sp.]